MHAISILQARRRRDPRGRVMGNRSFCRRYGRTSRGTTLGRYGLKFRLYPAYVMPFTLHASVWSETSGGRLRATPWTRFIEQEATPLTKVNYRASELRHRK